MTILSFSEFLYRQQFDRIVDLLVSQHVNLKYLLVFYLYLENDLQPILEHLAFILHECVSNNELFHSSSMMKLLHLKIHQSALVTALKHGQLYLVIAF